MSSADDPGFDPREWDQVSRLPSEQVHSQLVEALILLLIEKGVLTKNDALSVVQSVAQVQVGRAVEAREAPAQTQAAIRMLKLMYKSFEALADRSGVRLASGSNVHQLRPPIYGDRLEFPRDD